MKYWKHALLGMMLAVSVGSVHAHGLHSIEDDKPITRETAIMKSNFAVLELVESHKLFKSWTFKTLKDAVIQETPTGKVWVVSYVNSSVTDPARQTIYVFLDELGNYLGSNYTGKRE